MRKFDTKVQHLKYKVLREVARQAWADTLLENVLDIPKTIVPGKTSTMRCCVYTIFFFIICTSFLSSICLIVEIILD